MKELQRTDPEVYELIKAEERYEFETLRLIPSENYASAAVIQALGSVLTNKYSEGYAGKRYYEGQRYVDQLEELAIERAKSLFGVDHANVQPYSGSPANMAVYYALLEPGDTIMGLSLPHGGHLTHGWDVNFSAPLLSAPSQYTVDRKTHLIDYDAVRALAKEARPKIIVCGATAYPRLFDFKAFGEIAKEVGAYFLADIAHIAGLIAAGVHPESGALRRRHHDDDAQDAARAARRDDHVPRGVRPEHRPGGLPGAPGRPARPHDRRHRRRPQGGGDAGVQGVRRADRAQRQGDGRRAAGARLRPRVRRHRQPPGPHRPDEQGRDRQEGVEGAGPGGDRRQRQHVPYDPRKPFSPSGIRIGSPAVTSRGMKEPEMRRIVAWMDDVIGNVDDEQRMERVRDEVREFCSAFPAPGIPIS